MDALNAAINEFHLNYLTHYKELKASASELQDKTKLYLQELKKEINLQFGKYSQIADIEMMPEPFEKTATQKIKRYLYC